MAGVFEAETSPAKWDLHGFPFMSSTIHGLSGDLHGFTSVWPANGGKTWKNMFLPGYDGITMGQYKKFNWYVGLANRHL